MTSELGCSVVGRWLSKLKGTRCLDVSGCRKFPAPSVQFYHLYKIHLHAVSTGSGSNFTLARRAWKSPVSCLQPGMLANTTNHDTCSTAAESPITIAQRNSQSSYWQVTPLIPVEIHS
ncbi:hypothetical protein M404DRAFT_437738 [Pisolithus tinctorius Marx 270]|uniref:Uncharacterized protein n=1 Tax=Pisolithus tinctorius Marx 270 TaxID=870435 RepID=A0A0C3JC41_PISTI|nr:hypothetical protein M404DRAFT_437738 [Pisolithus tinctorius Marx 270]